MNRRRFLTAVVLIAGLGLGGNGAAERGSALLAQEMKSVRECLDFMYYDQAVRLLGEMIVSHPDRKELRYWQAYALMRMGRLDQSVLALQGELQRNSGDISARILLALVYYQLDRTLEAERLAREAGSMIEKKRRGVRSEDPNEGLPFYILGLIRKDEGRTPEAVEHFHKAAETGYDPADAWLRVLECDLKQKRWDEVNGGRALAALSASNRAFEYQALAAAGFIIEGRKDKAFESIRAAYEDRPFEASLLATLAFGYAEKEDFEEAENLLTRAVILNPQDLTLRYRKEDAAKQKRVFGGEFEQSLRFLVQEICSNHPPIFRYIFYRDQKTVFGTINQRFLKFVESGLLNDAAVLAREFLENDDRSPTVNYNLGQLYNTLKQIRYAYRYAFKAIFQKPDYRDAHDLLGNLYFQIQDVDRSIREYRRALELSPEDPVSLYHLGFILMAAGQLDEAETLLRESIEKENLLWPEVVETIPAATKEKGEIRHSLTVREDAIAYLAHYKLGELYDRKNLEDRALRHYLESAKIKPKAPEPYLEIGRILISTGNREKAKEYLDRYLALGGDEARVKAALEKKS